jgi:hypothetical protein
MFEIVKTTKIYFIAFSALLMSTCNKKENCEIEINKIEKCFFKNKKTYNYILNKFIENNESIDSNINKYFLNLKINNIRKCRDFESGEYEINFIKTDQCDYVIQSVNFRYSKEQLVCKKTNEIDIKQLDKNWYLVIIRD